jgi:cell division protein FtsB
MVDVWTLDDAIAAVEGDVDDASSQADLDDLHERLDDLEAEIADSDIPADADEADDLDSQVAAVREQVPDDWHATVWRLEAELEDVEAELEDAELEAELDEIEADVDEIETEIDGIDWGDGEADDAEADAGDEDDEGDEDEGPDEPEAVAALRETVADLRGTIADKRGPYAEDVQEEIESAEGTLADTDWTPAGRDDAAVAVEEFLDLAGSEFVDTFEAASESPADLAAALADVRGIVGETGLDADDDRETILAMLDGAETLAETIEGSEAWTDLTVQQELERRGFYDVLTPKNRKDYPPEWTSVKLFEQQYKDPEGDQEEAIEMILLAMEKLTSDFMEENILDSLERIAPPEAFDELEALAQKRNQQPIRILGRIGDERALETIHDYVDGGDTALRKVTLRAIGMIGSEDSTQVVANQLVDEDDEVRSTAARALGLIGDTRAIDPLADVLESDETDEVRASAAWALNQIGTERAREAAAAHADDTAYIVQVEAEKAQSATEPAA